MKCRLLGCFINLCFYSVSNQRNTDSNNGCHRYVRNNRVIRVSFLNTQFFPIFITFLFLTCSTTKFTTPRSFTTGFTLSLRIREKSITIMLGITHSQVQYCSAQLQCLDHNHRGCTVCSIYYLFCMVMKGLHVLTIFFIFKSSGTESVLRHDI